METLYESVLKNQYLQKEAIYFENKIITYKQLINNINKMVNYFLDLGIKQNDVVTLVLPNIPSCIYSFYALNAIGAIQNILHPLTPLPKILKAMELTHSKTLICLRTLYSYVKNENISSDYKFIMANPYYDRSYALRHIFNYKYKNPNGKQNIYNLDKYLKYNSVCKVEHHDTTKNSIYLHSGGTTGEPKIIALSDDSFTNLALKATKIIDKPRTIKMLGVLPIFHGFGLGMGIHAPLAYGASVYLMFKFDQNKLINGINNDEVNCLIGIPRLYEKLLKNEKFISSNLKNLRYCFVGGEKVNPEIINEFNDAMVKYKSEARLYEGYGLTETVTVCFVNTKDNYKVGSVGKPLDGIKVLIKDEEQNNMKPNEVGEIYISGNTLMNEYLFDPEQTNKTLVNIDDTIWVRTGDLGYIDEDGFLFISGRKKRLIIISGFNVFPSEIEQLVMEIKDVSNAVIMYFETAKPHMNLYVIKKPSSKLSDADLEKIIFEKLEQNLTKYSIPYKIIFMEKFPRTPIGKIDKSAFKDE